MNIEQSIYTLTKQYHIPHFFKERALNEEFHKLRRFFTTEYGHAATMFRDLDDYKFYSQTLEKTFDTYAILKRESGVLYSRYVELQNIALDNIRRMIKDKTETGVNL